MDIYLVGIWSLFVNALIKAFYAAIHSVMLSDYCLDNSIKLIIYVITACVLPFVIHAIMNSEIAKRVMSVISRKTLSNDLYYDVIDHQKRTVVIATPKDSDYYYMGVIVLRENPNIGSHITLMDYLIVDKKSEENIRDTVETGLKSSLTIDLRDMGSVEFVYEDDSNVWEWLHKDLDTPNRG